MAAQIRTAHTDQWARAERAAGRLRSYICVRNTGGFALGPVRLRDLCHQAWKYRAAQRALGLRGEKVFDLERIGTFNWDVASAQIATRLYRIRILQAGDIEFDWRCKFYRLGDGLTVEELVLVMPARRRLRSLQREFAGVCDVGAAIPG